MNIVLYDINGKNVNSLTQWNDDISIEFRGAKIAPVPEVRYSNKKSTQAICRDAHIKDGSVWSVVPNELLWQPHPLEIQLVYNYESGDSITEYRALIRVNPFPKPDGHAYTPSEVKSWVELSERIDKLEQSGTSGDSVSVTDDGFGNISIFGNTDDGIGNITLL